MRLCIYNLSCFSTDFMVIYSSSQGPLTHEEYLKLHLPVVAITAGPLQGHR